MLTKHGTQDTTTSPDRTHRPAIDEDEQTMISKTTLARVAGLLYLAVAVLGGFSQLFVRPSVIEPGDAAATAANISSSSTLFRMGFIADLVSITLFLLVAIVLYVLLKPINEKAALAMVVFNAVAVAIMSINMVNHAAAYLVATSADYSAVLGDTAAAAQAMLFLDLHSLGYLVAEIFFGLWLLPLGYLVLRSGYFPKILGVLLMIGTASYVGDVLVSLLFSDAPENLSLVIATPAGIAELAFLTWLSVMGAKSIRKSERLPAVA
ncbi:MAG: DUF4386 domain-containing protein [Actinomycetota bacterium]|nr:DUF4386 domain-containing protein [Actinomycetota bacterium]